MNISRSGINSEIIKTENIDLCPVCNGHGSMYYHHLRDRSYHVQGEWGYHRCKSCGVLWLNPRPISSETSKLYINYFTHSSGDDPSGMIGSNTLANHSWVRNILLPRRKLDIEIMQSMFLKREKPGNLLDIGCGDGSFLAQMRESGWKVIGLEPDPKAAQRAREKFGLDIIVDDYSYPQFSASTFDAVTLSHVIEHLSDPIELIYRCHDLLNFHGKLAIITPNIESLGSKYFKASWWPLDPPRHFVLFNQRMLGKMLWQIGFRIISCRTYSRTVSGVYNLSSRIAHDGYINGNYSESKFNVFVRSFFVLFEYWTNFIFGSAGEEIGILAEKI